MAITFRKTRVANLLIALGQKNAGTWPIEKLGTKISDIVTKTDGADLDEKKKVLFDKIAKAVKADKEWTISDEEEAEAPAAKKSDKKVGKKDAKKSGKKKTGSEGVGSGNGPKGKIGVTATVKEMLFKASKSNPLYLKDVMKVLLKKFGPDSKHERPEKGLATTAYAQLNFQLRNYAGYDVRKTDEKPAGFWCKGKEPIESLKKAK